MHKKPKTLYWYENHTLMKHRLTSECMPYVITRDADSVRWRCRADRASQGYCNPTSHDHYGYASLKEAKANEIQETMSRIACEKVWLEKLKGKT